jgi:hypothetical protein
VDGRWPALGGSEAVLRRRRATKGDGEELLAALLGLDLKPEDETVGERFIAQVEATLGPAGLHRALAHPENLPDSGELAEPSRWLERTGEGEGIPDDVSALFGELGEAPREGSADERTAEREAGDERDDERGDDDEPQGESRQYSPRKAGASGDHREDECLPDLAQRRTQLGRTEADERARLAEQKPQADRTEQRHLRQRLAELDQPLHPEDALDALQWIELAPLERDRLGPEAQGAQRRGRSDGRHKGNEEQAEQRQHDDRQEAKAVPAR